MRKGMGKGLGMGYKNIAPMDSHIHSLSAKGQKSYLYGKSYTLRWQVGRSYEINKLYHLGVYSTSNKAEAEKQAMKYDDAKIRSDRGQYTVLVPYTPLMTNDKFKENLKKYKKNYEKLFKVDAKGLNISEMIYDDQGRNVWVRAKGKKVVDWTTGKKGEIVDDGYSWADVKWEDGTVEKDVAKWKLNSKTSLATPKQPKTVYHKGMYSKDADEKNMKAMKEKSTRIKKEISKLLYEVNEYKGEEAKDHEMMVITVLKDKLPHFDFLTAHTDIDATGYWKSKITDVSYDKEKNAVLQIEFLDTKNEKVGKRLLRLFEDLNDVEIGEELLYVKTQPLEETSLPLEKWR